MNPKQWVALLGFGGLVLVVGQFSRDAAMLMLSTVVLVAVYNNIGDIQSWFKDRGIGG